MTINITIKQTGFAVGLALGVLIGIWLASLWLKPSPCPDADTKPTPKHTDGDEAEREGTDALAVYTKGRRTA